LALREDLFSEPRTFLVEAPALLLRHPHHKELQATLAEAAELQEIFKTNPFEYKKFIETYFTKYTNQRSKGRETSHDLLYCVTGAKTRKDKRQVGTYVRVVDYMIAKKREIGNFGAFLNKRTYTGVLELPLQDKRPAISKDKRTSLKVDFDEAPENLLKILAHSPHQVEFCLECTAGPGPYSKITAKPYYVSKAGQFKWTKKQEEVLTPYYVQTARAHQELIDEVDSLAKKRGRRAR
jgi:hypothetical protein